MTEQQLCASHLSEISSGASPSLSLRTSSLTVSPGHTSVSPLICRCLCSCEGPVLSSLPVNRSCQVAPLRMPFSKERIRSSECLSDSSRAARQGCWRAPAPGACLPHSPAAVLAQVRPPSTLGLRQLSPVPLPPSDLLSPPWQPLLHAALFLPFLLGLSPEWPPRASSLKFLPPSLGPGFVRGLTFTASRGEAPSSWYLGSMFVRVHTGTRTHTDVLAHTCTLMHERVFPLQACAHTLPCPVSPAAAPPLPQGAPGPRVCYGNRGLPATPWVWEGRSPGGLSPNLRDYHLERDAFKGAFGWVGSWRGRDACSPVGERLIVSQACWSLCI